MEINEILGKLISRQIIGVANHEQMANLFDLLNLHGYKRLNEFRFFEESSNLRKAQRFCISITDKLAILEEMTPPKGLPDTFLNKSRKDIGKETKYEIVKSAFEKSKTWEEGTLKLLNELYISSQQIKAGEVAYFIMRNIEDVTKEIKNINRELQIIRDVSNLDVLIERQNEIHEKYKEKLKNLDHL